MLLKFKDKKKIVSKLNNNLLKCLFIILINFKNFKCNSLNILRKEIYKCDAFILVLRNNLLKLAIKNTNISFLSKFIIGPSILIYSNKKNINNIFKILYLNDNYKDNFALRCLIYEGRNISLDIKDKLIILDNFNKSISYFCYYLKSITILKILNILLILKSFKT